MPHGNQKLTVYLYKRGGNQSIPYRKLSIHKGKQQERGKISARKLK